jgi:hypothetical protein
MTQDRIFGSLVLTFSPDNHAGCIPMNHTLKHADSALEMGGLCGPTVASAAVCMMRLGARFRRIVINVSALISGVRPSKLRQEKRGAEATA